MCVCVCVCVRACVCVCVNMCMYIYIYTHNSCILTTCYMWCVNEICYSPVDIIISA